MQGRPAAHDAALPDDELVRRVKSGQSESFAALVAKYQDRIFNTCWRICGNLEDARDLTQDAFLKVFETMATFRQESGFYTWIFRVAVNLSLSHRRKVKRHREVALANEDTALGTQAEALLRMRNPGGERGPADSLEQAELLAKVAKALHNLDEDQRAVVVLRDLEGFDYHEIGAILQIPPGTVRSRLHRAREELRRLALPAMKRGA